MRQQRIVKAVASGVLAIVVQLAASAQPAVNPQAAALQAFSDRTREYMALHEQALSRVRPAGEGAGAEAVGPHRDALAAEIRKARPRANEGDIFVPEAAAQFRAVIRRDLRSRDFLDAIAAVEEVAYRTVRVNMSWPPEAPRATIPARLLASLHPLPDGLEYRLLDRHLVLLDVDAQLVVDLVRNVLPSSIRPKVRQP